MNYPVKGSSDLKHKKKGLRFFHVYFNEHAYLFIVKYFTKRLVNPFHIHVFYETMLDDRYSEEYQRSNIIFSDNGENRVWTFQFQTRISLIFFFIFFSAPAQTVQTSIRYIVCVARSNIPHSDPPYCASYASYRKKIVDK